MRNIASWRSRSPTASRRWQKELGKLGAGVEAGPEFLKVTPRKLKPGSRVETTMTNRMAMSLSLAAFGGMPGINDPDCVGKTFRRVLQGFCGINARQRPVGRIDGP